MIHDIYKQARDTAWRFLIDNEVNALPVKLSAICHQNCIALLYDNAGYLSKDKRGITFIDNDGRFNTCLNQSAKIYIWILRIQAYQYIFH